LSVLFGCRVTLETEPQEKNAELGITMEQKDCHSGSKNGGSDGGDICEPEAKTTCCKGCSVDTPPIGIFPGATVRNTENNETLRGNSKSGNI